MLESKVYSTPPLPPSPLSFLLDIDTRHPEPQAVRQVGWAGRLRRQKHQSRHKMMGYFEQSWPLNITRAGLARLDLIKTCLIIVKKIIVFCTKYFIIKSDNLDDKI